VSTAATDKRKYRYGPQTENNYISGILTNIVEIPTPEFVIFDDDELDKKLAK